MDKWPSKERSESAKQILLFSLPQFSSHWFFQLYLVWPRCSVSICQDNLEDKKSLIARIPQQADKSHRFKLL